MKTYTLSNGVRIPVIGFGTYKATDEDAYRAVLKALEVGYRHIDTASLYGNEVAIGKAIADSGIDREDIFVTTKVWNDIATSEETTAALDASLERLGLDYVDLYLIHWPNPAAYRDSWQTRNASVWRAIEDAYRQGKIKAIGVSNFHPHHIDALLDTATIKPMVNQIYLSPSDQQEELVAYNAAHGILSEAWSPLARGKLIDHPLFQPLSEKYGKTSGQLMIRWSLQKGFCPLPKSVTPERIASNFDVFDFSLTDEELTLIDSLHEAGGLAPDPDHSQY